MDIPFSKSGIWQHPFTDIAEWTAPYVGYAYTNGLTNGIPDTQFRMGTAEFVRQAIAVYCSKK